MKSISTISWYIILVDRVVVRYVSGILVRSNTKVKMEKREGDRLFYFIQLKKEKAGSSIQKLSRI